MGRYAFFSPTGFEYKFRFAVQSSSDIRTFGGVMLHRPTNSGDFVHEWDQRDKEYILGELKDLVELLCIAMPDFESYETNLDGTQQLSLDLYKLLEGETHSNEEIVVRFRLGCFLYHQLMYVEKLTVQYET